MQTQNENYWMQETKFYEWLDSFCTGSYAGLEIFGGDQSGCEIFIMQSRKRTL